MTIYEDRERSIHDGAPIECYEFIGTFNAYRYTSGDVPVSVNGQVYTPLAINRSEVKAGTHDDDGLDLEIELPYTATLVQDYAFQVTPPRLTMTIYRVHRGTNFGADFSIYWTGEVAGFAINADRAKIRVPSVFGQALGSSLPSVYFQAPCNHVLFDSGCKVLRSANIVETTVKKVTDTSIELNSTGGKPDGWFTGGEILVKNTGERRMVVKHEGAVLLVNYAFARLTPGVLIEVTAGCNHAFNGDCKNKFDNGINFGGHPFIPSINVFEEGL